MQIFVKTLTGKTITLDVESFDTIETVNILKRIMTSIPGKFENTDFADARRCCVDDDDCNHNLEVVNEVDTLPELPKDKSHQIKGKMHKNKGRKYTSNHEAWEIKYQLLKNYFQEHGTAAVPKTYVTNKGVKLGSWVDVQRQNHRKGNLSEERERKLFIMEGVLKNHYTTLMRLGWEEYYQKLKECLQEYYITDIPVRYVSKEGIKLGIWLDNQRREYRNKTLSKEREIKLMAINIDLVNKCNYKTQIILYEYLKNKYEKIECEKTFQWCKNKRFDFYIKQLNIIIELDGAQHFIQVSNWKSPEEQQKNDIYKMKKAIDHKISVIRILQEDVLGNRIKWEEEIKNKIEVIKQTTEPTIQYICCNNEYENHQKLYENE